MIVYDIKEKSLPLNIRILVYVYNTDKPGWYIDEFQIMGKSDNYQLNGCFYPHCISHWSELPEEPNLKKRRKRNENR